MASQNSMLSNLLRPMPPRDPSEPHRTATPLELFFDLISVIAISAAAAGLHHAIADGHAVQGMIRFVLAFFAIWWAWMNYTWFASAYDNDDTLFRLLTMVIMAGALTMAAGISLLFDRLDLTLVIIGYIIMRLAMVVFWLRAAVYDPVRRSTALSYAIGIAAVQIYWLGFYMQEALGALLGKDAPNLSPAVFSRLKAGWQEEFERWKRRDLSARSYVYIWADGVYLQARMEPDKQCILVLIGATPEGKKELIGFQSGYRESAQSWRELLADLRGRGLSVPPELAIGDGALGFWKALEEEFGATRQQRCCVHKTLNVLNKLPKSVQPKAKADLKEIWMAAFCNPSPKCCSVLSLS